MKQKKTSRLSETGSLKAAPVALTFRKSDRNVQAIILDIYKMHTVISIHFSQKH